MIRLNITAEGFSEERFVTDILRPHLINFNIYTHVRKVLTNKKLNKRGGIVEYAKFRKDVSEWILSDPEAFHTTLIDLYGLKPDFPGYHETIKYQPYQRVSEMEDFMMKNINHYKFIPYIQLHEYETLMFSDTDQMQKWLSLYNKIPSGCFKKIRDAVQDKNPELINEKIETAPSKRIISLCDTYDKVNDGILILKEIGLHKIRSECKHFDEWVTKLEALK